MDERLTNKFEWKSVDGNPTTVSRCNGDGDAATRNATTQQWPCYSNIVMVLQCCAAMVEFATQRCVGGARWAVEHWWS
jgi:hypothetical protein